MCNLSYKNGIIDKTLDQVILILKKYLNQPFRLYLFGSFATKTATPYSDIDLALETKENLNRKILLKIKDEIENIRTLRKIDFIYFNEAPVSLKNVIKKEGVLIYEFN